MPPNNPKVQNENGNDDENIDNDSSGKIIFYVLVILAELLGIVAIVLIIVWCNKFMGGFSWHGGAQFNYHPLFMVLGLIVFYGNSAMTYRVLRSTNKMITKIIHTTLHVLAFVFAVLGLVAVFAFHNNKKIPNVYSLHSWIGIGTVVLFSCQLVFGFICFMLPFIKDEYRKTYLKIHIFFGMAIFALAVVSCVSGLTEKLGFSVPNYSDFVEVGNMANTIGIVIALFAMLVGYILYNPNYKRQEESYERIH